jgi:hypothetical protein
MGGPHADVLWAHCGDEAGLFAQGVDEPGNSKASRSLIVLLAESQSTEEIANINLLSLS